MHGAVEDSLAGEEAIIEVRSMRDDNLLRDPEIRRAVAAYRDPESPLTRSRHWPIEWLIGAIVIGILLIVLVSLIQSGI